MRILAYIVFGVLFFHLVGFVRDRFTVTQAAAAHRAGVAARHEAQTNPPVTPTTNSRTRPAASDEGTEFTRVEHRDGSIEFSPVYLDGLLVRCRTSAR